MSWDELEKTKANSKEAQEKRERLRADRNELAKKFNRVFSQGDGKEIFDHLFQLFVLNNDTPLDSKNVTYEAGYHAGEAGVIKYITSQITKAQNL